MLTETFKTSSAHPPTAITMHHSQSSLYLALRNLRSWRPSLNKLSINSSCHLVPLSATLKLELSWCKMMCFLRSSCETYTEIYGTGSPSAVDSHSACLRKYTYGTRLLNTVFATPIVSYLIYTHPSSNGCLYCLSLRDLSVIILSLPLKEYPDWVVGTTASYSEFH
jgi:hypothetical protein